MDVEKNIWKVFGSALIGIYNYTFKIKRKFWRLKFLLESSGYLSKVVLGVGQRFDVPVRVGGGLGQLSIGDYVGFGWDTAPKSGNGGILLEPRSVEAEIIIGSKTLFSNNVSIISMRKVTIGENCLIGDGVSIMDSDFHSIDPEFRMKADALNAPVFIGDNVWIGSKVLILRGVSIGKNSVIGAGSVVTKDIPENILAVGVPASKVRDI